MENNVINMNNLETLRPVKVRPTFRRESVGKLNVKLILQKKGWFMRERQNNYVKNPWNNPTLIQWLTQISGWVYVIKTFIIIFFIDDQSDWNHYLGEFSPAISKLIKFHLNIIKFDTIFVRTKENLRPYTSNSLLHDDKSDESKHYHSSNLWFKCSRKFLLVENL